MSKSFKHSNKLNAKNHNARTLQMESLENRELLSVVSPFASADNLTESVTALVSTVDPANVGFLSNTNQDIPLPPQYKAPQLAPTEGGLSVPLVQTSPSAETPLVVELDAPLSQTTPMAANAGTTPTLIAETPLIVNLDTPQIQTTPQALAANNVAAKKIVVNTVDDVVNNDRYTSLREAIQNATDGTVITFASNLKGKTINVTSCLYISKGITIDASSLYDTKNDEPGLIINMLSDSYVIMTTASNTVTIKGIEFVSTYGYRGIFCAGSSGSVTNIQNCHFHNLYYACYVGYSAKVTVNLDNCRISDIPWVGLLTHNGNLFVNNSSLNNCGYGIINGSGCKTTMKNSSLDSSTYGITNEGTSLSIYSCSFKNNSGGHVIYNSSGCTTYLYNSLFVKNKQDSGHYCFENYGDFDVRNITVVESTRTFKNESVMYVRNSICSSNSGNAVLWNCITATNAGLDDNYRPTASSACVNAGNNSYNTSDTDLAGNKRIMGGTIDIGCYEYFPVYSESKTSGKTTVKWEDAGTASYTVQYRVMGTEKWTSKTVKNQTEVTLSLKKNTLYEVRVAPAGTKPEDCSAILTGTLAKLGVKVVSKTENSISFQISNKSDISGTTFMFGIQKQNEDMEYFSFSETSSSKRPKFSNLSYTFTDNILTIKRLDSNTKYKFDFLQSNISSDASATSTPASVTVTTNKTAVTQTIVVKSATQSALKEAINQAPEGAVITFDKSLDGETITLSKALTITRGVTIDASNLKSLTIFRNCYNSSSDGFYKAFLVSESNSTVKFVGITFKEEVGFIIEDGITSVPYRGIETQNFKGNLIIEDCCFDANCTQHILSTDSSTVIVRRTSFYNSRFDSNTCIIKHNGKLLVENCFFQSSSWHHISGCNGATIIVKNSSFCEDVYGTNGKATVFYLQGESKLEASGCEFTRCKHMVDTYSDCSVTMKDCSIFMCGYFYRGNIKLIRCIIDSCHVTMFKYANLTCYSCVFDNNSSDTEYLFYMPGYEAAFYNCTFTNNGVSIFAGDSSSEIIVRNTITDKSYNTSGFATSVWTNCVVTTVTPLYYYPNNSSATINKGDSRYYPVGVSYLTDINGNPRTVGRSIDIGAVEMYSVKARSTTSNNAVVSWEDYGTGSYTVKYRVDGTTAWTTKVVKGKTSTSLSLKANQIYEVKVIPKGMENEEQSCPFTYATALNKLTARVSNKTNSSVSFQISQISTVPDMYFSLGIKKQNEKTYTYYTFYKNNSGNLGSSSLSYTFNSSGELTIKGLESGTKYNFQFAQQCDGGTWFDSHSFSPYVSVSAATN